MSKEQLTPAERFLEDPDAHVEREKVPFIELPMPIELSSWLALQDNQKMLDSMFGAVR